MKTCFLIAERSYILCKVTPFIVENRKKSMINFNIQDKMINFATLYALHRQTIRARKTKENQKELKE